jgi:hypothetical protein
MVLAEIIHLYQYIGGKSLQDKYSISEILRILLGVYLASPIQKVNSIRQYIGGIIAERNILSPLCLYLSLHCRLGKLYSKLQ